MPAAHSPARDSTPGLNGALRELIDVCRDARMASEGATVSLGERVSGGKSGSAHLEFSKDLPVSVELERTIRRVADVYRQRVGGRQSGVISADKSSAQRKAQTRAILGEVGMDPTAVAFMYGMTTESVRRLRGKHGRDPDTGQHSRALRQERIDGASTQRAPLTAPANAALERLEERRADGEVGQ